MPFPASPQQHTLAHPIQLGGIGLHTGLPVRLSLLPAPEHSGRTLRRADLPEEPAIPLEVSQVISTHFATSLGTNRWRVGTVEHVLAALYLCGVDNVCLLVDGPELPLLDGSALPFVEAMESVGLVAQPAPRKRFALQTCLEVRQGEALARLVPAPDLALSADVTFDHPAFPAMSLTVQAHEARDALAPARTFGFLREVEVMQRQGLIRGASLENALVMGETGWLNPPRFPDEPVRHKLLDALGDLALTGVWLQARYEASRGGHALNVALARQLVALMRGESGDG